MLQSRLLRGSLFVALVTIGVWANDEQAGVQRSSAVFKIRRERPNDELLLWNGVERSKVKSASDLRERSQERIPKATSPREGTAPSVESPQTTVAPQKRQDDGQIQALSSRIQSLSQSATQAISSASSSASSAISLVSQSAQSVRQSADQAIQSANRNADEARRRADDVSRQLSQTQSSASSAISAAQARASDQLGQSLASMSSRISANAASVQAEASSSIADAFNIASSQIQAVRADPSGVTDNANSQVSQVQSNSFSGSNVAIIITAAIVGTAVLTTIASCLVLRYRQKKKDKRSQDGASRGNYNEGKPIAIRDSPGSPRFTPWAGGTYPMDNFKLPALSPIIGKKIKGNEVIQSNLEMAPSNYSVEASDGNGVNNENEVRNVIAAAPSSLRLQKDNGLKHATSVRLIRVGNSDKGKSKTEVQFPPSSVPEQIGTHLPSLAPKNVTDTPAAPDITQPPKSQAPPPERSRRMSMRPTARDSEVNRSSWRPPVRSTMTTQQRLRFRDSSDIESAEPTPTGWRSSIRDNAASIRNTNTASLRTSPPGSGNGQRSQTTDRRPKNAGASFATFPKIRSNPPPAASKTNRDMMSRGRPNMGIETRLRVEAERRQRELNEASGNNRQSVSAAN